MKNPLLILCLSSGLALAAHAQSDALHKLDADLTAAYKTFVASSPDDRVAKSGPQFLAQLSAALQDPLTMDGALDSLATYITMAASPDKKVKFYSWDALEGGTWHTIHCFAQFRDANGKVQFRQIDTGKESTDETYTDSGIHEVKEIVSEGHTYYLTRAWGTHGSGMQFELLRVYQFMEGTFDYCELCTGGEEGFVIEYARGDKLHLEFDPVKNIVSYQTLSKTKGTPTSEWTSLRLSPHIWSRD